MSTVYSDSFEESASRPIAAAAPVVRKGRRWLWLLVFAALGVLALPTVIGYTPLRNWALGLAADDLEGELTCGSLSLGWFSSIEARDLLLVGRDGEAVVQAPRVGVSRSLLSLITSPGDLGTIEIENPQLTVVLRNDGSNVEDVLAKLLDPNRPKGKPVRVTFVVTGGTASIEDAPKKRRFAANDLAAEVELLSEGDIGIKGTLSAKLEADPDTPKIECEFQIPRGKTLDDAGETQSTASGQGRAVIKTDNFPLELAEAVLRRFDATTELSGRLTTDATFEWPAGEASDAGVLALRGRITADALRLSGGALGTDQLQLRKAAGPIDIAWNGKQLNVKQTSLECDVGRVSLQGAAPVERLGFAPLAAALATASLELTADIDIAPLAAMLPRTLHVRPGTRIVGGKLQASFGRRAEAGGQTSTGSIELTHLAAEEQGQRIAWDQPLRVAFDVSETPSGLAIRKLACEADFLQLNGAGTLDSFRADTRFDLDRLVRELGRFVDLKGLQLAGTGEGKLELGRNAEDGASIYGQFDIQGFRFALPGDRLWQEELLRVRLNATGQLSKRPDGKGKQLSALYTATVAAESSGEQVRIQLAKPVYNMSAASEWPLALRLIDGNLANWSARLRPWVALGPWQAAGNVNVTANVGWTNESFTITELKASANNLALDKEGTQVYADRDVTLLASGRLDRSPTRLVVYNASLRGTGLAADGKELRYLPEARDEPTASGEASFQVDLARASSWLLPLVGRTAPTGDLSGQLTGVARLETQGTTTRLTAKVDGDNLGVVRATTAAAQPGSMLLIDRRMSVVVDAAYDRAADVAKIERCEIGGEALQLSASGTLTSWRTVPVVDITGKLDYDLERLAPILAMFAGDSLKVTGRGPQSFSVRGPLDGALVTVAPVVQGGRPATVPRWRAELAVDAGIAWQSIVWQQFSLGPGQLRGSLAGGRLTLSPLEVPIEEGKLKLAPQFFLASDPVAMALPKGEVLNQVRLTPDLCAVGLKYIHPFLAGATSVNGRVSMDLEGAWIPLSDPRATNAAGKLKIHNVEVSGGPLLGDVLPAILMLRPTKVPLLPEAHFWIQNGRVYHKDVGIQLKETTVTTTGSVGFDETIDLVAEMTVPEKWLGQNGVGRALRNQKIKIPIGGTLNRPVVDAKRMAQLRQEFLGEAAGNILRDEIFDKLLKPRQPGP